jgi:hypothetical protein
MNRDKLKESDRIARFPVNESTGPDDGTLQRNSYEGTETFETVDDEIICTHT